MISPLTLCSFCKWNLKSDFLFIKLEIIYFTICMHTWGCRTNSDKGKGQYVL